MQAVTVAEAQRKLPDLVEQVKTGEDVVITRQGIPIAWLAQTQPQHGGTSDLKQALAELADMRANQRGVIPAARPVIAILKQHGMFLSERTIDRALVLVGE